MNDRSRYMVLFPDETRGGSSGPSSPIPTLGAASTAFDLYRTVAVAETNLPDLGAAFTDVSAVAAISQIAEGGITNVAELEAAETALQALLLHDIVHVVVPAPKVDMGNGLISYIRTDTNSRSQFGFDLFALVKSRDWLVAPEFIRVADGMAVTSTLLDSNLIDKPIDVVRSARYWSEDVAEAINVTVEEHGVPGYFTDPALNSFTTWRWFLEALLSQDTFVLGQGSWRHSSCGLHFLVASPPRDPAGSHEQPCRPDERGRRSEK